MNWLEYLIITWMVLIHDKVCHVCVSCECHINCSLKDKVWFVKYKWEMIFLISVIGAQYCIIFCYFHTTHINLWEWRCNHHVFCALLSHSSHAYICNYFVLLDDLINTREDVEFFVEKGIIVNALGSNKAVAIMVN